jgi:hypothetical protein
MHRRAGDGARAASAVRSSFETLRCLSQTQAVQVTGRDAGAEWTSLAAWSVELGSQLARM